MNSAKYILDSNGTAVYDGERIMVVDLMGTEAPVTLKIKNGTGYLKQDLYKDIFELSCFEKFYKLMERQVINE